MHMLYVYASDWLVIYNLRVTQKKTCSPLPISFLDYVEKYKQFKVRIEYL